MAKVVNYLAVSERVGTGGQPTPEQFVELQAAGYEVVINLAMPTSTGALPDEKRLVLAQGMGYEHIPVVWESPTMRDLERFFDVMDRHRDKKVFVHCALNYRVSAFIFLYRVLRLGESPEAARAAMAKIWTPNETWQRFIDQALADRFNPPWGLTNSRIGRN